MTPLTFLPPGYNAGATTLFTTHYTDLVYFASTAHTFPNISGLHGYKLSRYPYAGFFPPQLVMAVQELV